MSITTAIQTVTQTTVLIAPQFLRPVDKVTQIVGEYLGVPSSPEGAKEIEKAVLMNLIGPKPFVIEAEKVNCLKSLLSCDEEKLLRTLVPIAKGFARPPISNYYVGAAGLGGSGSIYLGVNLEFPGFPLSASVHAEQFLLANAREHQESSLTTLAVSAAPCGHCRQFLNEIQGGSAINILLQGREGNDITYTLGHLLPDSFGPQDLGLKGGLLTFVTPFKASHPRPLLSAAIQAGHFSYAPYTHSKSGVAIETEDGTTYTGSYMENAAYNPSLSPLQVALVSLVSDQRTYDNISKLILAEPNESPVGQKVMTEAMIRELVPKAQFQSTTQTMNDGGLKWRYTCMTNMLTKANG